MLSFFKNIELKQFEKYLILCALCIHLFLASYIGLSPDEAHYALYAKFLDWSYYDHPPMVGWLQYIFYKINESEFSLRILPTLSWLLSLALILKMTQKIKKDSIKQRVDHTENRWIRWSILIFIFSPLLHLLSFALVPDTLLIPLVLLMMICTWNLLEFESYEKSTWKSWMGLGLVLGLAGLTKYTSIFFAISIAYLILKQFGLKILLTVKLWTAFVIALVCISPVVYWNQQHDWISFNYQLNHAAGSSEWLLRKCIVFLLVLILAYGPLFFMGLFIKTAPDEHGSFIKEKKIKSFFFIFSLPSLVILIFLSGRGSTLPHWAAPALVAVIPYIAFKCEKLGTYNLKIFNTALIFQVLSSLTLIVFLYTAGFGQETGHEKTFNSHQLEKKSKNNPFADLYGWSEAGERAIDLLKKYELNKIAVTNWTLASRIAWYARPVPVNIIDPHHDQFDIWFGTIKVNESILWVDWSMMPFKSPIEQGQFESCELIEQLPIYHFNRQISHFNFSKCSGWQGGGNQLEK